MKSKYDQIMDADEFKGDFLKRTKELAISPNNEETIKDIVVASRSSKQTFPGAKRLSDKVRESVKVNDMFTNNPVATNLYEKGGKTMIGDINKFTDRVTVTYRQSKKSCKGGRK